MDSDLDWISHEALQQLTGAHPDTVRRWKQRARRGQLARWLRVLVNTVHRGQLDAVHAAWRGWLVNPRDGELVSPEGLCVTQGMIRALPQLYELRRALECELQELRAQLARLSAGPVLVRATCAARRAPRDTRRPQSRPRSAASAPG